MRVLLLSLLILVAAATAPAQETPEAYLGDRMPYAAFDRLPATRIVVPGGEIVAGIAPGPLDLPRARLLDWIADLDVREQREQDPAPVGAAPGKGEVRQLVNQHPVTAPPPAPADRGRRP